jgi:hypothetical protein
MKGGKVPNLTDKDLSWHGNKIFIEQAPEPNDIDWEFMHISTNEKIVCKFITLIVFPGRIKAWIIYIIFEFLVFMFFYAISM